MSEKADCDIEDIRHYIASVLLRPDSADKIVAEIHRTLERLADSPEGAAIYEYEPWKSRRVRCTHVRRYRIFYALDKKRKIIKVIRIAYAGFNPETLEP